MKILKLFKVLSRKTVFSVLMTLKDSCGTPSEISKSLGIEVSKIQRALRDLERMRLVRRIGKREGEDLYDLASVDVYRLLQSGNRICPPKVFEGAKGEKILDVRGEICPVPLVELKRVFENSIEGELIEIWVDYPLSKERILSFYREHVVWFEEMEGFWRIVLRK